MNNMDMAIELMGRFSDEKLKIVVDVLKALTENEDTRGLVDVIMLELSCGTEDVSPEEKAGIFKGKADIEEGLGVEAKVVWEELGV